MVDKRTSRVFAGITAAFLLMSCGGLSSKQKVATDEAIKSLRKVQAATQVGVNYQQYGQLVIEAKAQVNGAASLLPENELKKQMTAAMDAYADAGQIWGGKIQVQDSRYSNLSMKHGLGMTMIPKYSLPTHESGIEAFGDVIEADLALQLVWAEADKRLEQAGKLVGN